MRELLGPPWFIIAIAVFVSWSVRLVRLVIVFAPPKWGKWLVATLALPVVVPFWFVVVPILMLPRFDRYDGQVGVARVWAWLGERVDETEGFERAQLNGRRVARRRKPSPREDVG